MMTLRDKVWNKALTKVGEEGDFKISDLGFDDSQRHTVRRVLKQMKEMRWLSREDQNGDTWRLGQKAFEFLALDIDEEPQD